MPPSPLVAFHQQAITAYDALVSGAMTSLGTAQGALAAAEAAKAVAVNAITAELDKRTVVQNKLAAITLPAEAAPLLVELEAILVALRHQQAALIAAGLASTVAAGKVARFTAQLRRAEAGKSAATSAKAEAATQELTEIGWRDAINDAAFLATVTQTKTDWDTAPPKPTANHTDAKKYITDHIPAALLTRARAAATLILNDVIAKRATAADDVTAINLSLTSKGGLAGEAQKITSDLEAARAVLQSRAVHTLEQIDRALRLLAGVAASAAPSASEAASITAKAAIVTTAQALVVTEEGIDPTSAATIAAKAAVVVAFEKLEAVVPDHLWQNLDAFDEAERILASIVPATIAAAETTFVAAETALALKLTAQLTDTLDRAAATESLIEHTAAALAAANPERIFSALRGDA